MDGLDPRKERLEELLALAQAYRGWTLKQLAEALGRDPSNLVPASGVPKLDLVTRLSKVLDWPIEHVVGDLCAERAGPRERGMDEADAKSLGDLARVAHSKGDFREAIDLARRSYSVSQTPSERAVACNREAAGWDGLGRYSDAVAAIQRGLEEREADLDWRLTLRSNLASYYYALGYLFEGTGIASGLIDWCVQNQSDTLHERACLAMAYYVRGNCYRCMVENASNDETRSLARMAVDDLSTGQAQLLGVSEELSASSYSGIANTCTGALYEVQAVLGDLEPDRAIEQIVSGLESVTPQSMPHDVDWLESYGWWCVFGCNIALRHLDDGRALQRHMAIFTNKADEIAEQLGNWALRERVWSLEYARRRRLEEWVGLAQEWTVDSDDLRSITGAMGRFPHFRSTAWQILRSARVIRD